MECLLAFLSTVLFKSETEKYYDPWLAYVLSPKNQYIYPLIYSLSTFGLSYDENGTVPYGHFGPVDGGDRLKLLSLQILNVFLDFQIDENKIIELSLQQIEFIQILEEHIEFCEAAQLIKKKIPNSEV